MTSEFHNRFAAVGAPTGIRFNAEPVTIRYRYFSEETGQDEFVTPSFSAIVDLDSPNRRFVGGDEVVTDGEVSFSIDDVTKAQLQGRGTIDGEEIRSVQLVIRGETFKVSGVPAAANGMIRCGVVSADKKHTNSKALDSIV